VALNFVQAPYPASHQQPPPMCARQARTKTRICCTRKTTPGLRALEKVCCALRRRLQSSLRARRCHPDQGQPHRGRSGIRAVLEARPARCGQLVKIEIEVDSLDQLQEVLDCGLADVVLIDNFRRDVDAEGRGTGRRAGW
jgi:nicotinate-nucleotide pyrophosphorylase (carboxylating)